MFSFQPVRRSHMDHRLLMAHTCMSVCPFPIKNVYIAKLLSSSLLSYTFKYNTKYEDTCTSTTYMQKMHVLCYNYTSCYLSKARVVEMSHVLLKELTWLGWCDLEPAGAGYSV
jgi:hypothetical protein